MIAVTVIVVCAFVAGGTFVTHALFQLPAPTGRFPVGTVSFMLHRPIELGETSPGRFIVQLWYPALASNDRAPYGTGVGGTKAWLYHHFVRTHSASGAAPALRNSSVVMYVPAWGGQRTENTALAEELASYGYTVAAFDDVTRDSPVLDRLAGPFDLRSERAYHASLALAHRRLAYEAQRASRVLDYLAKLNAGDPQGRFTGRLDLRHVGNFWILLRRRRRTRDLPPRQPLLGSNEHGRSLIRRG